MTDNVEEFSDPSGVVGPFALQAWAAGDVGVDAAGISDLLAKRVTDGWFDALPPAVARLMTNWAFEWSDAPGSHEIEETERLNLALLATDSVRGGYLIGRMALGVTATEYDHATLDQPTVDHLVDLVGQIDTSVVADLRGPSVATVAFEFVGLLLDAYGNSEPFANVAFMANDAALTYALVEFDRMSTAD